MKAENITKTENGLIRLTLNGVKFIGTEQETNKFLAINDCEPLKFEPQHWSETKQEWIPIKGMAAKHIENHLIKRGIFYDYEIEELRNNVNNRRDYLRRLIAVYDNYNTKFKNEKTL